MHNVSSRFRLITSETAEMNMHLRIENETTTIYRKVAAIVARPGMSRQQIDGLVSKALGNYALWRLRAIRHGKSGCFSAAAVFHLQEEYKAFMARHAARTASAEETERAQQLASDRAAIERHLAHYRAEAAKLEARLARLREP